MGKKRAKPPVTWLSAAYTMNLGGWIGCILAIVLDAGILAKAISDKGSSIDEEARNVVLILAFLVIVGNLAWFGLVTQAKGNRSQDD